MCLTVRSLCTEDTEEEIEAIAAIYAQDLCFVKRDAHLTPFASIDATPTKRTPAQSAGRVQDFKHNEANTFCTGCEGIENSR